MKMHKNIILALLQHYFVVTYCSFVLFSPLLNKLCGLALQIGLFYLMRLNAWNQFGPSSKFQIVSFCAIPSICLATNMFKVTLYVSSLSWYPILNLLIATAVYRILNRWPDNMRKKIIWDQSLMHTKTKFTQIRDTEGTMSIRVTESTWVIQVEDATTNSDVVTALTLKFQYPQRKFNAKIDPSEQTNSEQIANSDSEAFKTVLPYWHKFLFLVIFYPRFIGRKNRICFRIQVANNNKSLTYRHKPDRIYIISEKVDWKSFQFTRFIFLELIF